MMGIFRNTIAPLIEVPVVARVAPLLDTYEMSEKSISTLAPSTMVNGLDVFKIEGGPIVILDLVSVCVTPNNATASTLQWRADGFDSAATTFTGASLTLANAVIGAIIVVLFTTTTTAPAIYPAGVGISRAATTASGMIVPAGIIEMVIGVGSTTGTWQHRMRYRPTDRGIKVTALI